MAKTKQDYFNVGVTLASAGKSLPFDSTPISWQERATEQGYRSVIQPKSPAPVAKVWSMSKAARDATRTADATIKRLHHKAHMRACRIAVMPLKMVSQNIKRAGQIGA